MLAGVRIHSIVLFLNSGITILVLVSVKKIVALYPKSFIMGPVSALVRIKKSVFL